MSFIASRLKRIKPSMTVGINVKANALRAEGKDVLVLAAGEPDFDTPANIRKAAFDAIESGQTRYVPGKGTTALQKAIQSKFIKDNNKRLNTSMETLEVFSPLAQRLGMKEWQDELEDLSFKSINPDARNSIIDRLNYLKSKDENIIDEIRYELSNINALNFYIHGILEDGVSSNNRKDGQAKSLGEYLRAKLISVPSSIMEN